MAAIRIDAALLNASRFQCSSTDTETDYPTDAPIGSLMLVVDETSKEVTTALYYDGNAWNTITPSIAILF